MSPQAARVAPLARQVQQMRAAAQSCAWPSNRRELNRRADRSEAVLRDLAAALIAGSWQ